MNDIKIVDKPLSINNETEEPYIASTLFKDNNLITIYLEWNRNYNFSTNVYNIEKYAYFDTIQSAIDAADEGDTIEVSAGFFYESDITINLTNLTLLGAGEGITLIMPDPEKMDDRICHPTNETDHHGIIVAANGVTIKNLTIDGGDDRKYRMGITSHYWKGDHYNGTTIENVTVTNIYYRGIVLRRNGGITSDHKILGVTVTNGGCDNQGWAILGFNADNVEIKDSYVENWKQGIATGNHIGNQTRCDIQNNEVVDVTYQAYTLTHNNKNGSIFSNNKAIFSTPENSGTGIVVYQSEINLEDNEITGARTGISVGRQTLQKEKLVIGTGNVITGPGTDVLNSTGIIATDSSWEDAARNFVVNGATISNYEKGIWLNPQNGMTVDTSINNNKIIGNKYGMINNYSEIIVNATKNYWGHSTGPYNAYYNPSGKGNEVSNNVSFSPFYVDEDMNEEKYVIPSYTKIVTKLPYNYSETNNYWFNITLSDPNADNASLYLRYPGNNTFTKHYLSYDNGEWYYNETNLSIGTHYYRFWANDSLGNSGNVTGISTFIVANLTETEKVFDDTDDYKVDDNKTNVIVDNSETIKNISVSKNNTEPVTLTFNNRADNKVVFTNNVTLKRETSDKNLTVDIPSNTTMSSSDNTWDGTFRLPEIEVITEDDKDIGLAIKVGSNVKLKFDNPVKIVLPGQGDKEKVAFKRDGGYTDITKQCNSNTNPTNIDPINDKNCKILSDDNKDVIIWTYHFTTFLAYDVVTPTTTTTTTTRRSGGGGGGAFVPTPTTTDDDEEEVIEETPEEPVEETPEEPVEETPEEEPVEETPEEEPIDEEPVEEETEEPTQPGFLTGLITGATTILSTAIIVLIIGGLIFGYYRNYTVSGLSARAESLHRTADKLNKKGKYRQATNKRNKARELQKKADKKGY